MSMLGQFQEITKSRQVRLIFTKTTILTFSKQDIVFKVCKP